MRYPTAFTAKAGLDFVTAILADKGHSVTPPSGRRSLLKAGALDVQVKAMTRKEVIVLARGKEGISDLHGDIWVAVPNMHDDPQPYVLSISFLEEHAIFEASTDRWVVRPSVWMKDAFINAWPSLKDGGRRDHC